ncbi:enoyl-CoA hydratase/isomerase family protein [Bacillus sp. M6-12]|uniref:enoyl-CoA hydratase/isomerase family protein n=1 Tax=Bacillus sp. M6-12 TaxID=2054166 RepID=UPI0021558FCE|nr:enoyl-CoA hydratase/isomerase family protein [Bacillus sp. M6-12]
MNNAIVLSKEIQGCLIAEINRPEKKNAVNYDVMEGLSYAMDAAKADPEIKMLIITGRGTAFCSGGDLGEFHSLHTAKEAYEMLSKMGDIVYRLAVFPKPTAAFINGAAVGGGCEIAAACDFRFAKKGAKIGFVQGSQGITTGWGGASILFEKLPYQHALKLLLPAEIMNVEEAAALSFIDEIMEDANDNSWKSRLKGILNKEADVIKAYKTLLVNKWISGGLKTRIEAEIQECSRLWVSDAHMKAVENFVTRKKNI